MSYTSLFGDRQRLDEYSEPGPRSGVLLKHMQKTRAHHLLLGTIQPHLCCRPGVTSEKYIRTMPCPVVPQLAQHRRNASSPMRGSRSLGGSRKNSSKYIHKMPSIKTLQVWACVLVRTGVCVCVCVCVCVNLNVCV